MKFKRTTAEHQYIHVHVAMVEEHDELPSYPAEKTPVVGEEPVKAPVATVSRVKTSASADDIMLPVVSLPSVPRYDTDPTLLIYHALQAPHCLSSVFHMRQRCLCASAPFPLAPSSRRGVWMPPLPLLCMSRSTRVPSHHRLSFAPPPCGCRHCPSFACHVQRGYPAATASRSHLCLSHSIRVIRTPAAL